MIPDVKMAAAYIRVSTEDQVEYSPDAQLVEIRKYAAARGYVLPTEYVYVDEGISGKHTDKRPAFNRMIGVAKEKPKPFEAILLWKFSRFARNREDSIVYKSMLRRELGIDVVSVSEPLMDDKMSIIMEAMIEAMDEYYSINLAEEVKRGMTEKARRGGLQSIPAFGYGVVDNVLTPNTEEAALVRGIFERFIAGEGLFPIAKWLNDMGVLTHRGNRFENRTVEYILRNPVYIGKLRWNPSGKTRRDFTNENIILSDAKHPAIITMPVWEAAQARMVAVKAQWKYHGRPLCEHRDWISGLVRCANCDCTLIFSKPKYWKCNGYTRGACKTTQHVSDEKLKDMLLSAMAHDLKSGTKISYTIATTQSKEVDEISILEDHRRQSTAKLARLREAYLSGVETLDSYAVAKKSLEVNLANITAKIAQLNTPQDKKKNDAAMKQCIRECLATLKNSEADMKTKHNLAHTIISNCSFNKETNSILIIYRLTLSE